MGFLDRFRKPSMDSDDYKIRIKAIAAIDDESELSRIVCDDYNTDVRLTALKKINNQSTLANLLIKFSKEQYWPNHNISSYLLNKVDDKQTLVAAAKNINDKEGFDEIIEKLDDENIFGNIYLSSEDSGVGLYKRRMLLDKITDEKILTSIIIEEENYFTIKSFYENNKIQNMDLLEQIAENSKNSFTRKQFINLIDNQDVLKRMVLNDSDNNVVSSALEKIYDEDFIINIAENDKREDIRRIAIEKIQDKNVLKKIAKNDSNGKNRRIAIEKVGIKEFDDEEVLVDVLINSYVDDVDTLNQISNPDLIKKVVLNIGSNLKETKIAAIYKIDDKFFLIDLLDDYTDLKKQSPSAIDYGNSSSKSYTSFDVCEAIIKCVDDEDLLFDCLKNNERKCFENQEIRKMIISHIRDENYLYDIASDVNEYYEVRNIAIQYIDNELLLEKIALLNEEGIPISEELATERITSESLLINIAKNTSKESVCVAALKKITNQSVLIEFIDNTAWHIRRAAIKNLDDKKVLLDVYHNDPEFYEYKSQTYGTKTTYPVREEAKNRLISLGYKL